MEIQSFVIPQFFLVAALILCSYIVSMIFFRSGPIGRSITLFIAFFITYLVGLFSNEFVFWPIGSLLIGWLFAMVTARVEKSYEQEREAIKTSMKEMIDKSFALNDRVLEIAFKDNQ